VALGLVTPAAVQAAARGYFNLNAYTLAIVGPRAAAPRGGRQTSAKRSG
jgi:predicted Zn-dependent peptidase